MITPFRREVYHTFEQRKDVAQALCDINTQLASGDWIPLQVDIQNWPVIDTPVTLVFRTQTDWAFPTDFMVDDIRLITDCL